MNAIKRAKLITVCSILLLKVSANVVHAEVLEKSGNGFIIQSSAQVKKTPAEAWQQFLNIADWWDADHSWFGDAKNFSIAAKVGGCFCEVDGERQVEHMRVSFVDPNNEIRLLGGLGPLQMMAVHGAMSWKFVTLPSGGTEIVQRYSVSGYMKGGLDQLAGVVDAVQTSQLQRLQASLSAE